MNTTTTERQLTDKEKQDLEKVLPMWKMVLSQFVEHRMAVASLIVIASLVLIAAFAPVIKAVTGLDPEAQNPLNRYKPPMTTVSLPSGEREDRVMQFESLNPELAADLRKSLLEKHLVETTVDADASFELIKKDSADIKKALKEVGTPAAREFEKLDRKSVV